MIQRTLLCILGVLLCTPFLYAQNNDGTSFGVRFKGIVNTDLMYDSRQTVCAREGHLLLYPANELPDANGEDVNAKASSNMLAIHTRVGALITAPEAFDAKASGFIEAAFFGHSDGDVNGFQLRHAYIKLDWEHSSLLVGQYWHPMFIVEVFPGTVSFNTGAPFQPCSRNPQLRFAHSIGNVKASLTAAAQRDFTSTGPQGATSKYLRDAVLPIMNLTVAYGTPGFIAGAGANSMSLKPRLLTALNRKTDETVNSLSMMAYAKVTSGDFQFKAEGVLGENMTDLLMLGGYAVHSMDSATGVIEYSTLRTLSAWAEIVYGQAFQAGLFAGYTKNLGADDEITGAYYSRGNNIASVMRLSPRVQYTAGKVGFAVELEHTIAEYGTPNAKGVVEDVKDAAGNTLSEVKAVSNTRLLLSAMLFF